MSDLEFQGIEHYDIFPDDVIIFWADISDPPQEIQRIAQEIDGHGSDVGGFGVCVNYSFAEKRSYLVTDMGCIGAPPDDRRNIFYIDQNGDKHWFKTDIPYKLLDQIFEECGRTAMNIEKSLETTTRGVGSLPLSVGQAKSLLNEVELEKRLQEYMRSTDFQMDISALACDYKAQGLPVPPAEQLREEAIAEARKCLETVMACEAKGHLWKERADPENGTSTLTCRRCGMSEDLSW